MQGGMNRGMQLDAVAHLAHRYFVHLAHHEISQILFPDSPSAAALTAWTAWTASDLRRSGLVYTARV